jgi:hypothetical protein
MYVMPPTGHVSVIPRHRIRLVLEPPDSQERIYRGTFLFEYGAPLRFPAVLSEALGFPAPPKEPEERGVDSASGIRDNY